MKWFEAFIAMILVTCIICGAIFLAAYMATAVFDAIFLL